MVSAFNLDSAPTYMSLKSGSIFMGNIRPARSAQPLVRGNDLTNLLYNLIGELMEFMELVKLAFKENKSVGFGMPNVPLLVSSGFVDFYTESLSSLRDKYLGGDSDIRSSVLYGE
jgi:hypothetical protein